MRDYKEVLLKSSRRKHDLAGELEDELLAWLELDVLHLDCGDLDAFFAIHAAALEALAVGDEEALAADKILCEAGGTVYLSGADVFPVAERAEVALLEPERNALRVVRMPAE